MNKGIYDYEKNSYVKHIKKINWLNVFILLVSMYLIYSLVGMVAAQPITYTTTAGEYQCKGFPYGIKVCCGNKQVADYLGV